MELVRVHIAKSPCYPPFGVICEYDDGKELWDCDCASDNEAVTLQAATEEYDVPVTMWDDPEHYSNRSKT